MVSPDTVVVSIQNEARNAALCFIYKPALMQCHNNHCLVSTQQVISATIYTLQHPLGTPDSIVSQSTGYTIVISCTLGL